MSNESASEIDHVAVNGYVEFEFDLPQALLGRLVEAFEQIGSARLSIANAASIPDEQGVYQLFLDDRLVYIGKTDGDAGLKSRLCRHAKKLLDRRGLDPSRVSFEGDLIRYYGGVSAVDWNGSGFGSNDPGRERDTSRVKSDHFDAKFPIDLDRPLDFEVREGDTAATALQRLKAALPYLFRYEKAGANGRKPHPDLATSLIPSLSGVLSARSALQYIVRHLPSGWQVTALPGYVIMYKNDNRKFPSGTVVAVSG